MRISEKAEQIKNKIFFMTDQFVLVRLPYEKYQKSKNVKHLILMNVKINFLICPFLLKEYNLFRQNTGSSLEQ